MESTLKSTKAIIISGTGGAIHQYSEDEVRGYVNLINSYLKVLFKKYSMFANTFQKDDDLCKKKLPINPDNHEIFEKLGDGFIFA